MRLRFCALLAVLLLAVPTAAPRALDPIVDTVFTAIERQILWDYYHEHRDGWLDRDDWGDDGPPAWAKGGKKGLPPGLAKRSTLPPGLARQLARNGTLPPGLQGRALPHDLLIRLPRRIGDHEIRFVDDRAVLIDRATNLILDLLVLSGR